MIWTWSVFEWQSEDLTFPSNDMFLCSKPCPLWLWKFFRGFVKNYILHPNFFAVSGDTGDLLRTDFRFSIKREHGRDLTQSYDKSPFTHRKIHKATQQHSKKKVINLKCQLNMKRKEKISDTAVWQIPLNDRQCICEMTPRRYRYVRLYNYCGPT